MEMILVGHIITGIIFLFFVFTFHVRCMSVVKYEYLYSRILPSSFLMTFLSPELQLHLTYVFLFHYPGLCCSVHC